MGVSIEQYRQRIGCFARVSTILSSCRVRSNSKSSPKQSKVFGSALRVIIRLFLICFCLLINPSSSTPYTRHSNAGISLLPRYESGPGIVYYMRLFRPIPSTISSSADFHFVVRPGVLTRLCLLTDPLLATYIRSFFLSCSKNLEQSSTFGEKHGYAADLQKVH